MLTLPLEPTNDRANPLFKDASSCAEWLAQLQMTNIQLAHSQLLTQINELNSFPMRGEDRFETLEKLRETVGYVQDQYSRKLVSKPLPLHESELRILTAVVQLWHALVLGYQRCLQAYTDNDRNLGNKLARKFSGKLAGKLAGKFAGAFTGDAALLCQRCLLYSGQEIFEYLHVGYEFDSRLWHQLHELYAYAEEQNLHLVEVADVLSSHPRSSCHGVYIKTLLACHARPAELSRAQLQLLDFWLSQWASAMIMERSYTLSKGDAPPLALDMSSTHGLWPVKLIQHGDRVRYLAMVPLSKLLRVKIVLLQQGKTPQELDLDDQCNTNDCIDFLTFLQHCWCEEHVRFGERPPVTENALLCYGMENIYAQFTGRQFKPFGGDISADNLARKQIESFGQVLEGGHNEKIIPPENWNLENLSLLGAGLTRNDTNGGRLSHGQLLAVRPENAPAFTLAAMAWAKVALSGKFQIGVRFLPGLVEAISICATGVNVIALDKYVPAFLLRAVPALKIPPSLIIPRDWFQPGRVIEVVFQSSAPQQVKMGFSVERGMDFERISFTQL